MTRQLTEYIIKTNLDSELDTLIPELEAWNVQVTHRYEYLSEPTICVLMTGLIASWIENDPRIVLIEKSIEFHVNIRQDNAPEHLDRLDQRNLPRSGSFTFSSDGTGVRAYVLDSGCRFDHIEFEGRVSSVDKPGSPGVAFDPFFDSLEQIGSEDARFSEAQLRLQQPRGIDELGHGSHVAGILGSQTFGVAKNVTLKTARIFGRFGNTSSGVIIAGINAILADFSNSGATAAICNMSFGGPVFSPTPNPNSLESAILDMVNTGITCVAAAGNNGGDANNISPARLSEIITVGAIDNSDSIANFSNFGNPENVVESGFDTQDFEGSSTGSAVDIFAPGTNVVSVKHTDSFSSIVFSGTSMSSPMVAGVAALILENSPSATPVSVAADIDSNATLGVINFGVGVLPSTPNKLIYSIFIDNEIEWQTPAGEIGRFDEGDPYFIQLEALGFSGNPIFYSDVTSGTPLPPSFKVGLPPGAVLNGTTGLINSSGEPNGEFQDVVFEFTIRASDGLVFDDRTFTIRLDESDLPPIFDTDPDLGQVNEGEPISIQLSATSQLGGQITYTSVGDLPNDWTLTSLGFISGIAPLVFNRDFTTGFTITATDSQAPVSTTQTFTIVIKQLLDFLTPREPAWVTDEGNIGTAVIGEEFSFFVEAVDTNNSPQPLKYVFDFTSIDGSVLGPSGALPPGLSLDEDTGEIFGTFTGASTVEFGNTLDFAFTIFVLDGANIVARNFIITGQSVPDNLAPIWLTPEGNIGTVDVFELFEFQLQAFDPDNQPLPLSYEIITGGLPDGINLDPVTGIVAGSGPIVTENLIAAFTVRLSDGEDFDDRTFSLTVAPINFGPEWQTPEGQIAEINEGIDFAFPLIATDPNDDILDYRIVDGELPPIVSLNPFNGVLSGPLQDVDVDTIFTFTVRVDDSGSNPPEDVLFEDRIFSIKVVDGALNVNSPPVWVTPEGLLSTTAIEGEDYFFQLEAVDADNSPLPITFAISSGALPPGLALNQNTGVISGNIQFDTNLINDNFEFTLFAFDGIDFDSRDFSIDVIDQGSLNEPPEWITPPGTLGSFDESSPLSILLNAVDPEGDDLTFTLIAGILPLGLTLDSISGEISGIPDQVLSDATFNFILRVEDPLTAFATRTFSIEILDTANVPPLWITPPGLISIIDEEVPTVIALQVEPDPDGPLPITFTLSFGILPPGLSLNINTGVINGTPDPVVFDTTTIFKVTIDDGLAVDEREFSITVRDTTIFAGISTQLSIPFLGELRVEWNLWNNDELISDDDLFLPLNPNFGRVSSTTPVTEFRKEPKIFVANNLNISNPNEIFDLFGVHHDDFKILLSAPNFAVVRNTTTGDIIYEVIYMRVIDPEEGSAFGIPNPNFVSKNFSHLRTEILDNVGNTDTLPDWMSAEQIFGDPESVIGYIPAAEMAFVNPGKGSEIIERLNLITQEFVDIQSTPSTFDAETTTFDLSTTTFDDFVSTITVISKGPGFQFVGRQLIVDRYLFETTDDVVGFLKFSSDTPNPIWITPPGLFATLIVDIPLVPLTSFILETESPINSPITYIKIFGDFPEGLSFNNLTGQFAGTPTKCNDNKSFIIKATDAEGNESIRRFRIEVPIEVIDWGFVFGPIEETEEFGFIVDISTIFEDFGNLTDCD